MCLQVFYTKVQYFQSTPIWTPPNWTTPNWNTPVWTDVIGLMGQYNFPTPTPTYTNLHPPMGLPTFIFLKWAIQWDCLLSKGVNRGCPLSEGVKKDRIG